MVRRSPAFYSSEVMAARSPLLKFQPQRPILGRHDGEKPATDSEWLTWCWVDYSSRTFRAERALRLRQCRSTDQNTEARKTKSLRQAPGGGGDVRWNPHLYAHLSPPPEAGAFPRHRDSRCQSCGEDAPLRVEPHRTSEPQEVLGAPSRWSFLRV